MAHSRIFQVSIQPIEVDDYAVSSDFYENSGDFADYIGDEQEGDDRKDDIGHLADTLRDLFTLDEDGEALTYKGETAMAAFKQAYADCLREEADKVTAENILEWQTRYEVRAISKETHLRTDYRFKIEDWNGDFADTPAELISYVADKMKEGEKLYIGAVIDYHY
jgi:hypothetical protein